MRVFFYKIIKDPIYRSSLISLIVLILIVSLCIYYYNFIGVDTSRYETIPLEGKGQIGDSWGMFTSVFSALAFWGLLTTLIFQATSIAQAKAEAVEQVERYKNQQIEDVFFRMLNIHSELVKDIDLKKSDNSVTIASGRDSFTVFYNYLKQVESGAKVISKWSKKYPETNEAILYLDYCKKRGKQIDEFANHDELNVIGYAYKSFWVKYRADLGHYFRFLFNLFKYIDTSDLDFKSKMKYAKIIRSQLSDYELIMIFYNGLSDQGISKFKPIIEKYTLLDNLPYDLLFDSEHVNNYKMRAFNELNHLSR
ncbi:Uncharacterised protein [Serratia quinivorans]|uniref:Phage abortive infection protein n=1 Tax=Serratia quinivorans TaxID=137545 RepID=A0A380ARY0_9GAMM|nr:putative phage abortive infection protein [Serratia proteamaculans]RYM60010.1 hypothetical protein BSR03_16275 [Serratia proteamaculans]SUI86280.1 Uncharacterised protein [Serratia quinivorans]